jgi:hypothetical protein
VILLICAPFILLLGVLGMLWGMVAPMLGGVVKVIDIGHKAGAAVEGVVKESRETPKEG